MSKIEETEQFDVIEMSLIAKALALLLNERSRAFELAAEIANKKGQASPDYEDFGLTTILRLSRRCSSHHLEETVSEQSWTSRRTHCSAQF
ncbi:hypothetical protein [Paraburkholderia hospita]|uniref:hypothetical protein n=1 Tax=Paraburkholderia hospita TaxID=169430 RepID=UPI000B34A096|nr:hypothetical protein [Paraburkholderia hospita]OUL72756.1 hypothetical protein CA603_45355 [Paraburkholderia hospita]